MNHLGSFSAGSTKGEVIKEVQNLRDQTERLRIELVRSELQAEKVSDQLNCLIMLVKKAWTGERTAAMHVARIVGVAAPDFEVFDEDDKIMLAAKPKPRALNNWAVLTIGLLNRDYKRAESEIQENQQVYLQSRIIYLEEQLKTHRERLKNYQAPGPRETHTDEENAEGNRLFLTQTQEKLTQTQPTMPTRKTSVDNPVSDMKAKRLPPSRPLYRPGQGKQQHAWSDMFADKNRDAGMAFQGLYDKQNHRSAGEDCGDDQDRTNISYDNPYRYAQFGLFDVDLHPQEEKEATNQKKTRPLSGTQQKSTINTKARPQSAVVRGDRPMKYETTRPVSGKPRVQSAKERRNSTQDTTSTQQKKTNSAKPNVPKKQTSEFEKRELQRQKEIMQRQLYEDLDNGEIPLEVRIKKAESVVAFDNDLKSMSEMEKQFRQQTLELQKKLGFSPAGII